MAIFFHFSFFRPAVNQCWGKLEKRPGVFVTVAIEIRMVYSKTNQKGGFENLPTVKKLALS